MNAIAPAICAQFRPLTATHVSNVVPTPASTTTNIAAPSDTLDPGSSAEAIIRFTPTAEGDHEGALSLSADGWTAPYTLSLHGGGQPPPRVLWIGNYGRSILSDDYGATWFNDTTDADGENIHGGVWAEGIFVTVGGDSTGLYRTSADAVTWEETRGTRGGVYAIAYGDGLFVSAGNFGNLAWSTDGRTWFEEHYDYDTHLRNLVYGDGRFVSIGGERRAVTLDGVSWEHDEIHSGTELYGLAYGNGVFVATGTDGLIATTTDGITWTEQTVGTDDRYGVDFVDGLFVTADWPDGTYTSPDGLTWTWVSYNNNDVDCVAGEWALGESWVDALMRSTDGYTWEVTKPSEYDSWEYSFSFCIVQGVE